MTVQTVTAKWLPPTGGSYFCRVDGRYGWRAVAIAQPVAGDVLAALGGATGSVIADGLRERLTWLIAPDAASALMTSRDVTVVAAGSGIVVPPASWMECSRLYWLVPFRDGAFLTDVALLRAAIEAAGVHS